MTEDNGWNSAAGVAQDAVGPLITPSNYHSRKRHFVESAMSRKRENMTPLEIEARSRRFMKMLKERLGCRCANCGSGDIVEYHHVVPLAFGGTNELTNIVPLCYACHKAAHFGRHVTHYANHSRSNDGRPPKCDDETAFKALDLLADGQIGVRKCQEMMRLAGRTVPKHTKQYKRWCELRGISNVRNILDASITNGMHLPESGSIIGEVTYFDGTKKSILFNDTGLNDETVYMLRFSKEEIAYGELKNRTKIVCMQQYEPKKDVPDWFEQCEKDLQRVSAI